MRARERCMLGMKILEKRWLKNVSIKNEEAKNCNVALLALSFSCSRRSKMYCEGNVCSSYKEHLD